MMETRPFADLLKAKCSKLGGIACFATEAEALAELKHCRESAARGQSRRREQRVFRCENCGFWHLSSQPKDPGRRAR